MEQKRYIGAKIRELREARKWSADELASKLKTKKKRTGKAVQSWEVGRTSPDAETLINLCTIFGVEIDEFYYKPKDYPDTTLDCSQKDAFVNVPLYGSVAAGIPIEMIEDFEMKEAPAKFVEDDPDCFLARAKGNSENRRGIFDGDYVLVSPKYKEPEPGELFLLTVNGDEATIKEIVVLENGIELVPDSYDPTYTRQIYNFNEADTPTVENRGKIVWHCAPF